MSNAINNFNDMVQGVQNFQDNLDTAIDTIADIAELFV